MPVNFKAVPTRQGHPGEAWLLQDAPNDVYAWGVGGAGATGPPGATGPQGPQGIQGVPGATGATGSGGTITTADTATVDLSGDGSSGTPLSAAVIPAGIPLSSLGVPTTTVNMNAFNIINMGAATGGLHAMNRNSCDARYPQLSAPPYILNTGGGQELVNTLATATGAVTCDLSLGNVQNLTLTGNVTSLTITNAIAGRSCTFTLVIRQDGTGGRTFTFMAGAKWAGGTVPTLSTAAGKVDVLTFMTVDNGTTWLGFAAGLDMR